MIQQTINLGDWQTVIDAHPLESNDPVDGCATALRYGKL